MGMDASQNSNAPAPFLIKTYEMVSDPITDEIVSWSSSSNSFVVWNSADFAKDLLPQYFKHNNFSSFVRQLNTYGFRKIDPDRWEFANEGFSRGSKDSLKNIHRRKPSVSNAQNSQRSIPEHPAQIGCSDPTHLELEEEIKELKQEKGALVMELVRFREQQHGTEVELQNLGERLQVLEGRQQQMVTFLARCIHNPGFFTQFVQQSESLSYCKKRRLPFEEGVMAAGESASAGDPKAAFDVDAPFDGFLKQLTISSVNQSGGNSSVSHNSGISLREVDASGAHVDSPSTDGSVQSINDTRVSIVDAIAMYSVANPTAVRDSGDCMDRVKVASGSAVAFEDGATLADYANHERESKEGKSGSTALDINVCGEFEQQVPHAPPSLTKKTGRKTSSTSGPNDVFWENFLTESPRSTDTEGDVEMKHSDDDRSLRERQFL